MDHVREELEYAGRVFAQNPAWPVKRAIEETAAVVLRLYHDRKNKCLMPRISKQIVGSEFGHFLVHTMFTFQSEIQHYKFLQYQTA
ncbi:unnamed protein product [Linum tenue]|uniref:Uncharacterized protein n=1 Tax=Linum tenue TaxID=586396 RepID=A0AAV0KER6_9ROSI|nr:unnamed protein product [Linum tenue]CAI0472971.1 unnamed protein product [Linum tenue]